jgi:acetylornithine deacetylase
MADVRELLSELVAIDSVNPDLVPGGAGEQAIAQFVAAWLERAGLDVTLDEPVPGRPNVVGVVLGTGGGRSLMLNAHLDTVGTAGMQDPLVPRVEGNRLYGRGAYDMKGGLAAAMLTAAAVTGDRLRGDVILTAVIDEESGSLGTESILKRWQADAAVVTEPTALDLYIAHRGFVWLDVDVAGRAAHGSRPDLGSDAIVKMGMLLYELNQLSQALQTGSSHPLLGTGSLHASLISGGQERSSYPERCTLSIERRTIPGESPEQVESEIQQIIDRLMASDQQFHASVQTVLSRQPFEIAEDSPLVQFMRQEMAESLDRRPSVASAPWWADSGLLAAAGIPTVLFGPGGDGAHALVEWVDLDEVDHCVSALTAVVRAYCR